MKIFNRNYFIFLGRVGLIYYSWLFTILFIGLTFAYEGANGINWPAVILITIFFVLLIYTLLESYHSSQYFKLPFRTKVKIKDIPKKVWSWKILNVYEIQFDSLHTYYFLTFKSKKAKSL